MVWLTSTSLSLARSGVRICAFNRLRNQGQTAFACLQRHYASHANDPEAQSPSYTSAPKGTQRRSRVRPTAKNVKEKTDSDQLAEELSKLTIVPLGQSANLNALEIQDDKVKRARKLAKASVAMKKIKPYSPSLRWYRTPIYPYLHKGGPLWQLTIAKKKHGGRNHHGVITCRHRGGGFKRRIRIVDFFRMAKGPQKVVRIEHDPGRSGHIALIEHQESKGLSYILACEGLRAGDIVESFRNGISKETIKAMGGINDPALIASRTAQRGNCLPLNMVPLGTIVHNIGLTANGPAKMCRAAGTYGRLFEKVVEKNRAVVRLQSGEYRYVSLDACATIGMVSNPDHQHRSLGKAGRARNLGIRPTVRGLAMNKCDHPHGGGRGKSKGNKLSMSPWGTLAKSGYKTRRGKNINHMKVRDRPRGKANRSSV